MSDPRPVTKCVCHDVTFERALATREALDPDHELDERAALRAVSRATGAGKSCATCRPYLRLCLRTGETRFPILTAAQCAQLAWD